MEVTITFYLLFFFLIHFRLMDIEEQFLDYVPVGELMTILRSYATRQLVSLDGTVVDRGIRFLKTCSKLIEQIQDDAFFHQDF